MDVNEKKKRIIKTKVASGEVGGGEVANYDHYDRSLTSPNRTHVQYNTSMNL